MNKKQATKREQAQINLDAAQAELDTLGNKYHAAYVKRNKARAKLNAVQAREA